MHIYTIYLGPLIQYRYLTFFAPHTTCDIHEIPFGDPPTSSADTDDKVFETDSTFSVLLIYFTLQMLVLTWDLGVAALPI